MTIEKAKKSNVAATTILRQSHVGRVGAYPIMAAKEGMISIMTADSGRSPKAVAPFGGAEARFTTNPYCTAIPRKGKEPIVLDFATSQVAMGNSANWGTSPTTTARAKPARVVRKVWVACIMIGEWNSRPAAQMAEGAGSR